MEYSAKKHRVLPLLRRVFTLALVFALSLVFTPFSRADETTPAPSTPANETTPAPSASPAGYSPALGECSDDVLRMETRLSDLGFLPGVVDGVWRENDVQAFANFAAALGKDEPAAVVSLFSKEPLSFAAAGASTVFATGNSGFLMVRGSLMPWDEVKTRLQAGQTYTVTSCYSGISLHMVCVSVGTFAQFQPVLDWDNATLRGFFPQDSSSQKQPVAVTVDGIYVAASILCAPAQLGEELPVYNLYFHGSVSEINGIPDAEHEAVVLTASGG
jgi:hypothetical protein